MSNKSGYKQQQNLSIAQLLAELPSFVAVLVSAILSRNLLVYVDLLDSSMYLISLVLIVLLSKKLTKDLRYEYNYGVGKIEAIASLLCDGMGCFGLLITLGFSIQAIIFPEQPSDFVIAVVGLKVINVSFDTAFFVKHALFRKRSLLLRPCGFPENLERYRRNDPADPAGRGCGIRCPYGLQRTLSLLPAEGRVFHAVLSPWLFLPGSSGRTL